ncbi:MAG: type II secretion system F family protein [Planctomycetota bacterium]
MSSATTTTPQRGFLAFLRRLNSIEVGGGKSQPGPRTSGRDLAEILRLLLTLLENGLSLPRSLDSLAVDRSTRKHSVMLRHLRRTIEAGGSLSAGMETFPKTFTPMQIQQIRIGEKSGSLEQALERVCEQLERKIALRKRVIKKVSYPILITVAGAGLMIFMCVVVVPEFEKVYGSTSVDLPWVTRWVTATSRFVMKYGLLVIPAGIAWALAWFAARRRPKVSRKLDNMLLHLPIVGPWLRDVAVLQFAEGISAMVQCGYTPVEAVEVAVDCIRNREVQAAAAEIRASVRRGEKLSDQIGQHDRFFSATLCQLISVGERSGDFAKAMRGTCEHLRNRLESRIDASVGLLEPVLTIGLATAIGGIVLSIYTPMFHMFEVLE